METRVAVTAGDPNGIGPELLVRLIADQLADSNDDMVIISSLEELRLGVAQAGLTVSAESLISCGRVSLVHVDLDFNQASGQPSASGGAWALGALQTALALYADGLVDGLVFAPLNKTSLHLAGMTEPDEMRWFEHRLGSGRRVSEVNVNQAFWTSRVTSHVAMREVPGLITSDRVVASCRLLHDLLCRSGLDRPRIGVCALNPHAGENGLFGDEEIEHIRPGVGLAIEDGIDASGPFPADTIFRRGFDGGFDGIVTMFHDQGQIALKTRSFEGGVTLEAGLGLPICTPAHGTAFDLVGKRAADMASMRNAYDLARRLAVSEQSPLSAGFGDALKTSRP